MTQKDRIDALAARVATEFNAVRSEIEGATTYTTEAALKVAPIGWAIAHITNQTDWPTLENSLGTGLMPVRVSGYGTLGTGYPTRTMQFHIGDDVFKWEGVTSGGAGTPLVWGDPQYIPNPVGRGIETWPASTSAANLHSLLTVGIYYVTLPTGFTDWGHYLGIAGAGWDEAIDPATLSVQPSKFDFFGVSQIAQFLEIGIQDGVRLRAYRTRATASTWTAWEAILDPVATVTANAPVKRDASGHVVVPLTPTASGHATSKTYVDAVSVKYVGTVAALDAHTSAGYGLVNVSDASTQFTGATLPNVYGTFLFENHFNGNVTTDQNSQRQVVHVETRDTSVISIQRSRAQVSGFTWTAWTSWSLVPTGSMVGIPTFIQQTQPVIAGPAIWYQTDGGGNVVKKWIQTS